ncbi:MAG: hypothetical protein J0I49_12210 [Pseudonocardia sp.]|uniref:hypothetical protein n=1 Tax=Pseudonocardia sp. TaxID=60912 RepID=UPI001AD581EE|nr:hypothetical protein [Pseudonocardia sp.]MBN9098858.1 hypothetical protein [Pseudonocardia sp.]
MTTTTHPHATHPKTRTHGVARLVRRLERERRHWTRPNRDTAEIPTEMAWRAGVAEGLRLAQTAIRKGV